MQVSGVSNLGAPQGSDLPPGLPGDKAESIGPAQVLRPIVGARDADTQRSEGPPARFWRTLNGGVDPSTHIAPPSMMQIKITQMLDEQAVALSEAPEAEDFAQPEASKADATWPNPASDEETPETAPAKAGATSAETAPVNAASLALTGYEGAAIAVSKAAHSTAT